MRARPTLGQTAAGAALAILLARPAAGDPPAFLRETGLYTGRALTAIASGNLPFAPQYPLWTDGAGKRRWIRLPPGTFIDASRPGDWQFPVGTRLWKELSFRGRRVETRFIERLADGSWRYATYLPSAVGGEDRLAPAAGTQVPVAGRAGLPHDIPGQADCRACHEGRPSPVLGFSWLQLSPDRDPNAPHAEPVPPGAVDLRALVAQGLVRGLPAGPPPRIPARSPTARAALGYLHANCGHCHNDAGPLAPLDLALDQQGADGAGVTAVAATTVGQASQFRLDDGTSLRIAPGHPERAVLIQRMRSRQPVAQMPPLGTRLVDQAALALLERWIAQDLTLLALPPIPPATKENRP